MTISWLDLPGEVRAIIYRRLFQSTSVLVFQNSENSEHESTRYEFAATSSGESQCGSQMDADQDSSSIQAENSHFDHGMEIDLDTGLLVGTWASIHGISHHEVQQQTCMAILQTCKAVRKEAEGDFYAYASFFIDNHADSHIEDCEFKVDRRVQHLTIEQEPDSWELWPRTISFLQRHFQDPSVRMTELSITDDGFREYDDECSLKPFLEATLSKVEKLSFGMNVLGGVRYDPVQQYEFGLPDRLLDVHIFGHGRVEIEVVGTRDFDEISARLLETGVFPTSHPSA